MLFVCCTHNTHKPPTHRQTNAPVKAGDVAALADKAEPLFGPQAGLPKVAQADDELEAAARGGGDDVVDAPKLGLVVGARRRGQAVLERPHAHDVGAEALFFLFVCVGVLGGRRRGSLARAGNAPCISPPQRPSPPL